MTCNHVKLPGGGHAIVCTSGKAKPCGCGSGLAASRLCDWKVAGGTCDAPLCASCTHHPTVPGFTRAQRDKDLCPTHAAEWKARATAKDPKA